MEKQINYHFDKRLSSQQMHDQLITDLKKEFFAKSVEVYTQTSRFAFRCQLAGRSALRELTTNHPPPLAELWESFQMFQRYLENQAYIDARDYRVIHAYKRNIEQFCALCQSHVATKQQSAETHLDNGVAALTAFWCDTVEPSFTEVQSVVRIFSVKDDARS